MSSNRMAVLDSIQFILGTELTDVVEEQSAIMEKNSPNVSPHEVVRKTIDTLRANGKIPVKTAERLDLALHVAELSGNNETLIKAADERTNVQNLRDLALRFDTAAIRDVLADSEDATLEAARIRAAIFKAAPTPTVQGMVMNDKAKISSNEPNIKSDVVDVLSKLDIATLGSESVASLPTTSAKAFDGVPMERRQAVTHEVKKLARVARIAPTTGAMQTLVNKDFTTSLAIAKVPKANFLSAVSSDMDADAASQVHANAVNAVIRNENILVGLLQRVQGTGLHVIDGHDSTAFRKLSAKELRTSPSFDLNLENLFGSMDQCVCDDCTTVYSAASYFVDILQYLRASSTSRAPVPQDSSLRGQQPSLDGTVLEKLFRRRPDLGNLQLTCENTNTVLPYIDLANEVMESYITNVPRTPSTTDVRSTQLSIDVYNVGAEDSSELLSQPQNTNYSAYETLASATYPLTLPYHQPIDAQRAFLDFLKVPRLDLLDAFRQKPSKIDPALYPDLTCDQLATLRTRLVALQQVAVERQLDAEALSLVQEDYLILTGEIFFPKEFFIVAENISLTTAQYQERTGMLTPAAYWGYASLDAMTMTDEYARTGLQFVKKQFLPRAGIAYSDLTAMVRTGFLNPRQPKGRNKTIFEAIRFSYRFLQTMVDNQVADPRRRLAKLAEFLVKTTKMIHLAELLAEQTPQSTTAISSSGKIAQSKSSYCHCVCDDEVRDWVFANFEDLGKIVVLDSGEGPRLPIEGNVAAVRYEGYNKLTTQIGRLTTDGMIKDSRDGVAVASVDIAGRVLMGSAADGITINAQYPDQSIEIVTEEGSNVGYVRDGFLFASDGKELEWALTAGMGGSCNIDNVRLVHLDGTPLTEKEWMNFHKFIRIWRKLGWSVEETDMALVGLRTPVTTSPSSPRCPGGSDEGTLTESPITLDNFKHAPGSVPLVDPPPITTDTLHQLASIKQLLAITGLPAQQLLTLWTNIPTIGTKPLYDRLFFNGNIRRSDTTFGPNENGDYFTDNPGKISDHLLVILAAFNMKAADISFLMGTDVGNSTTALKTPVSDVLSIDNLSAIYRYGMLAKLLNISVSEIGEVLASDFPDPFSSPASCLDLMKTWSEMDHMGFTWPELRYVASEGHTDLDPLAPDTKTVLETAKTLHDGMGDIMKEHTVPGPSESVTADLVKSKAALIFEEPVLSRILQLLSGEMTYTTRAPTFVKPNKFDAHLTAASSKKAIYVPGKEGQSSKLQVTGILTKDEIANILGLLDPAVQGGLLNGNMNGASNGPVFTVQKAKSDAAAAQLYREWSETIRRAGSQPRNIFYDSLSGIIPKELADLEMDVDKATLLAPDISEEAVAADPSVASEGKTPSQKRRYFLANFIPFLQDKLCRVLVLDSISSGAGFDDKSVAQALLEYIALDRKKSAETAMDFLLGSLKQPEMNSEEWSGYLAPQTSDWYTFCVESDTQPPPVVLNDKALVFTLQQEDPERIWSTMSSPVKLDSGKLYNVRLGTIPPSTLQWKPSQGSRVTVPPSTFLPNRAEDQLKIVFTSLRKLAIVTNNFKLSSEEVVHIDDHPTDFETVDFMHLTVSGWRRLKLYVEFRDTLPKQTDISLLELYNWAVNNPDATKESIISQIAAATAWKPLQISQILDHLSFPTLSSANASNFRNGVNLRKFTQLITLSSKLGVDIPRLFSWARPLGTSPADFQKLHEIAEDIKKVARSKFNSKTWPDAVKPVNDLLRENQRNALLGYLLNMDEIKALGITDADGLFEYFLIDTQMTPLVETSRIKQAIATVQVYVQRCLLGLEEAYGVPAEALDRQRWNWMQKYRVWEANRKVFLYPENWLEPSLRDTKSEFFAALESELLQKDLTKETVSAALRGFLYSVAEVANMVVVGLCVDYTDPGNTIHLFCRTRTAPYSFYHNRYAAKRWRDWRKMAIEVPVYTVEENDSTGQSSKSATTVPGSPSGISGVYLAPMAYSNRIVVFIPQIMRKTAAPSVSQNFTDIGGKSASQTLPVTGWEIKLSWTEYRNGAWTTRKLCPEGILDMPEVNDGKVSPTTGLGDYQLVPTEVVNWEGTTAETPSMISILMSRQTMGDNNQSTPKPLGEWRFQNGQLSLARSAVAWRSDTVPQPRVEFVGGWKPMATSFGAVVQTRMIYSWQGFVSTTSNTVSLPNYSTVPCSQDADSSVGRYGSTVSLDVNASTVQNLYHTRISELTSASMAAPPGDDTGLFSYLEALQDENSLKSIFGGSDKRDDQSRSFDELSQPFSLYNWELGLHGPMSIIDRLLKAQQFEQALDVCHYIFNPMAKGEKSDMSRFWVFAPFKFIAKQTIEAFFQSFKPGEERDDVTAWRDNPFSPHVIARGRPVAYMKWVVMKYIEILIEYGDSFFRQNTLETIPNAIQMYILASHLFGPRGQKVKREGKVKPYTYNNLLKKFDAFSNALVQMEEAFPFSNQTTLPIGKLPDDSEVQMANVFGFAATLFFTIPDNPNLRALGERIDDRLFKIRHSQDINGVFRRLPLFEPPIDPALLVQATAQGLSLSSILTDLNGPMPNYRFLYILTRALEMAGEVKALGQALLAAKEKHDSESYSVLRASHESSTQNLVMEMKKLALSEANSNLEALQYSRNAPASRMRYYLQLAGEDVSALPGAAADFQELNEKLQAPVDQGGLKLLPFEKEEMDLNAAAATVTTVVGALETLAGVFNALPSTGGHVTPLGCGAVLNWGPPNIGSATSAVARGIGIGAGDLSFRSGVAGRKAQALRALNDRLQAANAAGYEISNIDRQIVASRIRIAMAARDVDAQQRQIDQAREAEDFLREKYSNAQLYTWMAGQTKTLYYGAYTAAYDLARKVEKAFRFERPNTPATTSFIQPGYWDASRDGLLAGEQLWCALKQLEAAYISTRGHDYEITKTVSLRQIDPMQLLYLREAGAASFSIPEVLFDMDFPGHHTRRLRSVSVTIPCVVGPYASVNATLRLVSHRYRVSASLEGGYAPQAGDDARFTTTNVPISAVAVSNAQADAGVFELSFAGDRYLPFEGAGAISEWRLELPAAEGLRPFEYGSISDVLLTVRYTSVDGGEALKAEALKSVKGYVAAVAEAGDAGGLCALFDLKNEFASGWARLMGGAGGMGERKIELARLRERLPIFAVGRPKGSMLAHEIFLLVDGALPDGSVEVAVSGDGVRSGSTTLAKQGGDFKGLVGYASSAGVGLPIETWTLSFPEGELKVDRVWLMIRYILK